MTGKSTYTVVLFGDNPYTCLSPDFSLMATGATASEAIVNIQNVLTEAVTVAQRFGNPIPVPSSQKAIERRWDPTQYSFVGVTISF